MSSLRQPSSLLWKGYLVLQVEQLPIAGQDTSHKIQSVPPRVNLMMFTENAPIIRRSSIGHEDGWFFNHSFCW